MTRVSCLVLLLALSVVAPLPAPARAAIVAAYEAAGGQQIAPGVEHSWGAVDSDLGRSQVHFVEVDPTTPGIHFETSLARDRVTSRERTTSQALRQSREEHRVVVTTNGSTFGSWPAGHVAARGLNVRDGELLTAGRIGSSTGPILSFAVDRAGRPMIGAPTLDVRLVLPDGSAGRIDRVNQGRLANEAVLYTPRFDSHTWTDASGLEVVISVDGLPLAPDGTYQGTVTAVRSGAGDSPIAAGQLVVSATGAAADAFGALVAGDEVTLELAIEDGWQDILHAVGGRELLVRDGEIEILPYRPDHLIVAHPRTAVGVTAEGKVLLAVVDGRSMDSAGLMLEELAAMMIERGAVSALNLDGGGSSTMAVRSPGQVEVGIVNVPSDGDERTVATTLQVISTLPTGPLEALVLSPSSLTLLTGESAQLAVGGHDGRYGGISLDPAQISWGSDGGAISVDDSGHVRALEPGGASVTVRYHGLSARAEVTVLADDEPPFLAPPRVSFRLGAAAKKKRAVLDIRWTASDSDGTVTTVELERRIDSGDWFSEPLATATAVTHSRVFAFGLRHQLRVRATDAAGNTSQWVEGPAFVLEAYNELSAQVQRVGSWQQRTTSTAIGGKYARSGVPGESAALDYAGAQVAWVGQRGPLHGRADIYLGGVYVARVGLKSSYLLPRQLLFVSPRQALFAAGEGGIEVRNVAPADRPRVDLDAFIVLRPAD